MRGWVTKLDNEDEAEDQVFHDEAGRPNDFDDLSIEALKDQLYKRRGKRQSVMKTKFNDLLRAEKINTLRRRHKPVPHDVSVSYNTEKRFKREHEIKERKAKDITKARTAAKGDIRVAYKQACALVAFAGDKPAPYKFNADATTFEIKPSGAGDKALVWAEVLPHDGEDENDPFMTGEVVSDEAASGLSIFLKWMHLCNAIGESGPLVLLAALPNMPEGTFFVQKVSGLTHTGELGGFGWLYCCRTRGGNAPMWRHWYLNCVCETLRKCREHHEEQVMSHFCFGEKNFDDFDALLLQNEFGEPARMFISSDGELVILKEVFNEELLDQYAQLNVDQMKHAPSRTDDYQANDKSPNFMNMKAGVAKAKRNSVDTTDAVLHRNLVRYMSVLKESFPNAAPSSALQTKLFDAIMCLVHIFKEKYFTPSKIRKGFEDSGEHVANTHPERGECTVNYELVMAKTDSKRTPAELQKMKESVPLVVAEMHRTGRASNAFLDSINIPKDAHAKDRDVLVLDKQDAQLITHKDTVERYKAYEARKELLKDPVHVALDKRLAKAAKMIVAQEKATVKKAKAAEAKQIALQKKEEEKQRKKGLTQAEIRQEAAARKQEKEDKKKRDDELSDKRLQEARDLLGPAAVARLLGAVEHPPVAQPQVHVQASVPMDVSDDEEGGGEDDVEEGEEMDVVDSDLEM